MSTPIDRKYRNAGARAERACWIAHLRRMDREPSAVFSLREIIDWGLKRKDRYEKRAGGIGRK